MEHPSSSSRRFPDGRPPGSLPNNQTASRTWSPTARPTLNTSLNSHLNPSNLSQHLSSSGHHSPWSPSMHLGPGNNYLLAELASQSLGSDLPPGLQGSFTNDWGHAFSSPLNPNTYAALAANSAALSASSSPSGGPPSHPSSYHSTYQPQPSNVSQADSSGSWSQSPSNFKFPAGFPAKPSLPRSNSLKDKLPTGMSRLTPIHFRPTDSILENSVDDRQKNEQWQRNHLVNGSIQRINSGPNIGLGFDPSMANGMIDNPSLSFTHTYPHSGERSHTGLPPSLWMSPASASVPAPAYGTLSKETSTPLSGPRATSHRSAYNQSPVSPTSPSTDSKSTLFTDIFSEELFGPTRTSLSPSATSPFTSPRLSGSPDLKYADTGPDPGQLAREDPLATQVWKMYARTKATLPHAQRMENLTWRMMALALKKKKEEDEEAAAREKQKQGAAPTATEPTTEASQHPNGLEVEPEAARDSDERGRRIDKGKAKVRVVGFDGTNQDGLEEPE